MSAITSQPPLQLSSTEPLNVTNVNKTVDNFYFYQTEQLTFLSILFIMIVMGNSAVLAALSVSKTRKSRMSFFIMHLAIADLLVGLISVLTDIVWKVTVHWSAGNAGCKLIRFCQVIVTYSSNYVLVALSIDRYDAIRHPMNFTGSWRRARFLVVSAWALSVAFSLPILYLYEERKIDDSTQCWIELPEQWHWQLYLVLVSITLLVFPTIIITLCYSVIVYTIWTKSKQLSPLPKRTTDKKNRKENGNSNVPLSSFCKDDYGSRRASSRGIIPKAKIKTIKMTFVIVFAFILCWSPYIIFDLLQVYGQVPITQKNIAIATFMQSMAPLNSAANPIIYCVFSSHTCRNLRKISLINWCAEHVFCCCPSITSAGDESSTFTHRTTFTSNHSTAVRGANHETRYNNGMKMIMLPLRPLKYDKTNGQGTVSYTDSLVNERLLKQTPIITNIVGGSQVI